MRIFLHYLSSRSRILTNVWKIVQKNSPCGPVMYRQTALFQPAMSPSKLGLPPAPGFLFWLLTLVTAVGCRTAPALPPVNLSDPRWTIQQGQAVWRSRRDAPEIAGELFLALRDDRLTFLQFTKTPLPFVVAQMTSDRWQIQFVADNKTFSGGGQPPARIAWLQLARCLAGFVPPSQWKWEKLAGERWRLENKSTGEMLEGYLTR